MSTNLITFRAIVKEILQARVRDKIDNAEALHELTTALQESEEMDMAQEQTNFPLLIQLVNGRRWLCSTPRDLPNGMKFKILETKCNIEIQSRL